jgi:uncharacterized protein (DUF1499 family)
MRSHTGRLALLGLVAAAVWAATAWPRLSDVETGRTPAYPDLRVREYAAPPEKVAEAVKDVLGRLPRWRVVGSGQGPGGHAVYALHETALLPIRDDVTVQIRRAGARTRVSVRSRSRLGLWDFGRNARNIRELLAALDAQVS